MITPIPVRGRAMIKMEGTINMVRGRPTGWDYGYALFKQDEKRSFPTRVAVTNLPIPDLRIGSTFDLQDSVGRHLGRYMIVGVMDWQHGEWVGDIPDRALHYGEIM